MNCKLIGVSEQNIYLFKVKNKSTTLTHCILNILKIKNKEQHHNFYHGLDPN